LERFSAEGLLIAPEDFGTGDALTLLPWSYPVWSTFWPYRKCTPISGQRELEIFGIWAHAGGGAEEPFMSETSALLPIALWGRPLCVLSSACVAS